MEARATLFDGLIAEARPVRVSVEGGALTLTHADGFQERVDPGVLSRVDEGGPARFARSDVPGWRLRFEAPPGDALEALLPAKSKGYGRWIDRVGLVRASLALGLVAAAVVGIGYSAPAWVAPLVPEQWERNLGAALVGDFGDNRCARPEGLAALGKMAERIEPGVTRPGGAGTIRFTAIDVAMFNAAALPGGQIVIFNEMLKEAEADALAGVLAHEIAHVRRRHVTQALVRELGIGALIRLFAGGIGADAQQLVALSFTRANEAEADRDSIAALARAGIDPRPTARLFEKLSKQMGESRDGDFDAEFLQSHPVSRERAKRFAASFVKGRAYRLALDPREADALADICWKGPNKG